MPMCEIFELLIKFAKKINAMSSNCENCNKGVFEKYGSGRFCSKECARSFSTKAKRNEINGIVSSKLGKYKVVSNEVIKKTILESKSLTEASIKLKMPYTTLLRKSKELGVFETKKNQGRKGIRFLKIEDVLVFNESAKRRYSGTNIKRLLFENKLKKEFCEDCGIGNEWNGKKLVLELEHVNGDWRDNRIKNLKILCPNCHSQTPTFRNKNKAQLVKR